MPSATLLGFTLFMRVEVLVRKGATVGVVVVVVAVVVAVVILAIVVVNMMSPR